MSLVSYLIPPAQPNTLNNWSNGEAIFEWGPGISTGLYPITNYMYQILLEDNTIIYTSTTPSLQTPLVDGICNYSITGFSPGSTFRIRVRSIDQSGHWSAWSPISDRVIREYPIKKPGTIFIPTYNIIDNIIYFSWEQPQAGKDRYNNIDPILNYEVEIQTSLNNNSTKIVLDNFLNKSFLDMTEGENIRIRVRANTNNTNGDWSLFSHYIMKPFTPTAPKKIAIPVRELDWQKDSAVFTWNKPEEGITLSGKLDIIAHYNILVYKKAISDNDFIFVREIKNRTSTNLAVSLEEFSAGTKIKIKVGAVGGNNLVGPWSEFSLEVQKYYDVQWPGPPILLQGDKDWSEDEITLTWQPSLITGNDSKKQSLLLAEYNIQIRAGNSFNPLSNELIVNTSTSINQYILNLDNVAAGDYISFRVQTKSYSGEEIFSSEWSNWSITYRKYYSLVLPKLSTPKRVEKEHGYQASFTWDPITPGINNKGEIVLTSNYIVELFEKKSEEEWEHISTDEISDFKYTYNMPFKQPGEIIVGTEYKIRIGVEFNNDIYYSDFSPTVKRLDYPNIPFLHKIGDTTIENNEETIKKVNINSLITLKLAESFDPEEEVSYRIFYNGSYTPYSGSLENLSINWAMFVGQTIVIRPEAKNQVGIGLGPEYLVEVGETLDVSFIKENLTLNLDSAFKIEPSTIDLVQPQVSEEIILRYWRNINSQYTYAIFIRTVDTINNTININDIFSSLYSKHSEWFFTSDPFNIYFEVEFKVGNNFTKVTDPIILTYTPHITEIKIIEADGSSNFKYPLDSTLPVVDNIATVKWSISNWPSNTEGVFKIEKSPIGKEQWETIYEKNIVSNLLNQKYFYNVVEEQNIGETTRLRCQIIYNKIGLLETKRIEWDFPIEDLPYVTYNNRIERRTLEKPSLTIMDINPDFLAADKDNYVEINYKLQWNLSKAYYISSNTIEIDQEDEKTLVINDLTSQGNHRLCYNNIFNYMEVLSYLYVENFLSEEKWHVTKIKNLDKIENYSIDDKMTLLNNANIKLYYKFQIHECYRNSLQAFEPNNTLLSQEIVELISPVIVVNTFMLPIFKNIEIAYERVE